MPGYSEFDEGSRLYVATNEVIFSREAAALTGSIAVSESEPKIAGKGNKIDGPIPVWRASIPLCFVALDKRVRKA